MIFFLNLNGTCTRQDTDHIYQGSNNASKVIAITGIASGQSHVDVAFTLPNGLTVGYLPMAYKGAYKLEDSSAVSMHLWELNLPYNVTEMQGTVGVSFNAVTDITEENPKGNNLTSYTNTFDVEYSALPELPSSATESELEQILNLLEAYAAVNPEIVEKLENFQIGTITAQAGEPGTQPRVTAEIVNKSLPNGYDLNMNFTLPTGEPAGFNRVTAEAETISAGSFAEADVTTSGPNTSKNFAFKFKIPKGDKGTSGQDGLDGAGVFALKQVYDSTTTKIPASDVEIPAGRYGQIKEFDMLIDTSGNMFRALAGNTPLNGNIITVRYYTSIKGEIGNTPDITVNATVDNAVGIPSVTVTESGTPEAPEINLSFHNLKGEPGDVSGSVTGVKGNNEAHYRQGNVNLTPENIGLGNVDDISDANQVLHGFIRVPATADLNTYNKLTDCGWYHCTGGNNVANKPKNVDSFYMHIYKLGGATTCQEIVDSSVKTTWRRSLNLETNVWSNWYGGIGFSYGSDINSNKYSMSIVNPHTKRYDIIHTWSDKYNEDTGNGMELGFQGNGNTFIGSGESATNLHDFYENNKTWQEGTTHGYWDNEKIKHELWTNTGERTYITSDNEIYLITDCQNTGKNSEGNKTVHKFTKGSYYVKSNSGSAVQYKDMRYAVTEANTSGADYTNYLEWYDKNGTYAAGFRVSKRNSSSGANEQHIQMYTRAGDEPVERSVFLITGKNGSNTYSRFVPHGNGITLLGAPTNRWKEFYAETIVPTLLYSSNNPTTGNVSIINGPFSKYKNLYMVIGNSDAYGSIYSMDLGFAKYWNIDGLAANYPSISVRLYNDNTLNIFRMGTQTKFIRIFGF